MKLSLVTPSVGRTDELEALLAGLADQPFRNFEWILVDQNEDDRLAPIVARYAGAFPIRHVHSSVRNASHARNLGLALAEGEIVGFPDDDCRYPLNVLRRIAEHFEADPGLSLLGGPLIASTGEPVNGRWAPASCPITERTVWITFQGSSMWMRTEAARQAGGWDPAIGPGTPWGSSEEPDLALRILRLGRRGWYDWSLGVLHPDKTLSESAKARAFVYGAGMGRVMRRNSIGASIAFPYFVRPLGGAVLSLLRAEPSNAGYYWNTLCGRAWGYLAPLQEDSLDGSAGQACMDTNA